MCAVVHLHELFERDVGVPLCGRQAGVPQELLNRAKIRAPFEHVRGARVA